MGTIDIALPDELTQALNPPVCLDLSLPTLGGASLTLPTGLNLQGMADFTRGIPTDCSMKLNLILQLAPIMASMECVLKILKFIGAIVAVLKDFNPLTAVEKVLTAAEDVAKCLEIVIPGLPICTFIKDLLTLISTLLLCVVKELDSILKILGGLQIQIALAEAAGNTDLLNALKCSQQNAQTSAEGTMQSLQPVVVLLSLAGAFMDIAGVKLNVTIPSAIPADDLAAMQALLDDIGAAATVIKEVAEALPC
jgi:hypothetical protein